MLKILGRLLNVAVWIGLSILVILLFIIPMITTLMINLGYMPGRDVTRWLHWLQHAQLPAMSVFCLVWVFFVGSCFASFLNVVAWRVPRGKSILGSSHCPNCDVKLKFPTTNIPVLGWLKNGGRCVNCEVPIPVRYLVAELVLGFAFLILFLAMIATGGATLPFRDPGVIPGNFAEHMLSPQIDLLITLVFQLTLLSVIFTLAIAATEKFSAPTPIVLFGIISLIGFQSIYSLQPGIPDFRIDGVGKDANDGGLLDMFGAPIDFWISMVIGGIASVLCFLVIRLSKHSVLFGGFASLLLIGISLGWQSVLSISAITCAILVISRIQFTSAIFIGTLLHLCTWRLQLDCQWWPGPKSGIVQLACGIGYVCLLTAAYRFSRAKADPAPIEQSDLPDTASDLE